MIKSSLKTVTHVDWNHEQNVQDTMNIEMGMVPSNGTTELNHKERTATHHGHFYTSDLFQNCVSLRYLFLNASLSIES